MEPGREPAPGPWSRLRHSAGTGLRGLGTFVTALLFVGVLAFVTVVLLVVVGTISEW